MGQAKWLIILIIIFVLLPESGLSSATSSIDEELVNNEMADDLSLHEVNGFWVEIADEYGGFIPELRKGSLIDWIKNNRQISVKELVLGFISYLFSELIVNGKLLGMLMMLTIFSNLLQTMSGAFDKTTVSKVAYFVVYTILIYLAMNSFFAVFSYTRDTIDMMSGFMIALIPLVLGLMATFGHLLTVSFFHPIVIFLIQSSGLVVSKIVLPLLLLSAILIIGTSINNNMQVTHLANLIKTISIGMLAAFLTIFLGVMSIQGAVSAIQDGVAMKTTKFITGNFIPVIGRTFTDATDTILSASLLLKNAVGVVGVIMIILIALFPAVKILALGLIYKIAAAVLQPIGDGPIIDCLHTISQYIFYTLACLLVITLMFFLTIVIIVVASNVTLLLR